MTESTVNRESGRDRPNEAWVSDLTYIRIESGWHYLAAIIDL